ncbi:MAG: hypothetical protein RIN55_11485 [Tissierellaceae bacterium]|nr:hypothetical protein [Tissierellaceae bacterium]
MAKDAIISVKEAEEKVRKMIEESVQASKRSKNETILRAEEEYVRIINEAEDNAKLIRDDAKIEGETVSKPILEDGSLEASKIIDISDDNINTAVNNIIERIVNANGNS